MLLAEANQLPTDVRAYFGDGDECHMAYHFPVMPRMFMALHLEDRQPIVEVMERTPSIPDTCQWALFLRNPRRALARHASPRTNATIMSLAYGMDPQAPARLGIRRRLAPLVRNDRRRIELLKALLFSLPGTPVIYYGDEIGMGDNLYLGDRQRRPNADAVDRRPERRILARRSGPPVQPRDHGRSCTDTRR